MTRKREQQQRARANKQAQRERLREQGLVPLELWTYPELKEKVKDIVNKLNGVYK